MKYFNGHLSAPVTHTFEPELAFEPEPVQPVQLFHPAPVQPLEPVPQPFNRIAPVEQVPVRSLPAALPTASNEIFGSSHSGLELEENYDYDPDYEAYKVRRFIKVTHVVCH